MSDVQVTQEDRDAAAGYIDYYSRGQDIRSANIRNGLLDDMETVQAFARHRLATRPALDVDWLVEKVARAMLDSIENGGNMTDFLDHLADYPERTLSKLATAALAAIKDATDAQ